VFAYAVVGMSSGVAWLLLFSYLRNHGDLLDPAADPRFFRLTEPAITLAGYGAAALIGWFLSPAIALGIFLTFPILYVLRVRSQAG